MSKYICLCGMTFKYDEDATDHCEVMNKLDLNAPYTMHKTFKQHWQARFSTWLCSVNWQRFTRFTGAYMVYFVFITHFHVHWSWWEATLIGIGMGLYIE